MTTATNLITLALNTASVLGVGQQPQTQDISDCFTVLKDMLNDWQLARTNQVNPAALPQFVDLTTDVEFPQGCENAILWGLSVRIRPMFGLPEDKQQSNLARNGYLLVQSINRQQSEGAVASATSTVLGLIQLALRMCGRSTDTQRVAPDSFDVADAFAVLVQMMAQWQRKRWLVPSLAEIVIPSTGAVSYPFGPSGDFSGADFSTASYASARTDRLENAFVRLITSGLPVDWPLYIVSSREDYNRITVKSLGTFPAVVFYDAAFPVAQLYFWPVPPSGQYEMHVFVKAALPTFTTVDDPLAVPPEYVEAMLYNLAPRLGLTFGLDVRLAVVQMAKASLNTVRMANTQIPELQLPNGISGGRQNWRGSGYAGILTGGTV